MSVDISNRSESELEEEVKSWGFKNAYTWTDVPNSYYKAHVHNELQTHLIIRGEFTIAYPRDDKEQKRETFGPGARIDVPARKVHEVWMGKDGRMYIIGC